MQTTRPHFVALCISFSTGTRVRTARHTRTDRSAHENGPLGTRVRTARHTSSDRSAGKGKAPAHFRGTGAFPFPLLVRADTLLDHFGDDLLRLVERDHNDGVGIGSLDRVNLSREVRRIGCVELLDGNLSTRLGEELLHVVGESLTI